MSDTAAVTYFAPAKVNLGLSVRDLRSDGYHELHSLMVPLSVGDDLEIAPADTLTLRVEGTDLPEDDGNLVFRAARAYLDAAGVAGGAAITLHKRLPLASGLGGGSSDAATTLMALARLYPAGVDLPGLALRLGADVPFFLLGRAAVASGVGEVLSPTPVPRAALVLLNPGVEVSARDAYAWLDAEEAFTPALDIEGILAALSNGRPVPYVNALQGPVAARHALIREALAALTGAGLHSPLMSGSGSTCFALARDDAHAHDAAQVLAGQHPGWWVQPAQVLG
ncbi:4-(cytidine 5'-diphospho)-2-C-methyl-D-erythritol kinase [Deinococcus soli (ex Cha et al. 2016)]|uniref:4-diphosphocytidyl-2-C-methyl-D-erythritol kinase n=2 Tax=Deinococcus soli (ex Cha et al. 2016) TaxID=1309411 RepID=A0ACC6KJU0_9DEIO|nr:4-(cytidine 5'-diphospho)-2-C-methyl-D-erythritol kinase [Deinococcus soli (ex Cha et al. 2016)]MDR6219859.1 4-diphosphocytidyl-2-C-methyl-D-erythritol kinase [Deinococcus soli (ex Cha et al. 2016)]MDR6329883.1 4-diphosphocytidyl-2-C-methyl-D-erythritol kinase [Deinococcus soli (ex Cha et al. 2016)]MDR6752766.1 4-diphosphocytidyl-2-C-methyl-D-erythritol kinase [Deinococcus soli (ex Cha et al. 2016)]